MEFLIEKNSFDKSIADMSAQKKSALIFMDDKKFVCTASSLLAGGIDIVFAGRCSDRYAAENEIRKSGAKVLFTDNESFDDIMTDTDTVMVGDVNMDAVIGDVSYSGNITVFGKELSLSAFKRLYDRMISESSAVNFVYTERTALYSFMWYAALCCGNSVKFSKNVDPECRIFMLPIAELNESIVLELPEGAILITFGTEIIDTSAISGLLKEKSVKWLNIPSLFDKLFVSKLTEETVMGKKCVLHKLISPDKEKLEVVNKSGKRLPPRVTGRIAVGENGELTPFKGIKTPDGAVLVTERADSNICVNGSVVSIEYAVSALRNEKAVKDCVYDNDSAIVYLTSDEGLTARQIRKLLADKLGEEYSAVEIAVLPFIPYDENGNADFKAMRSMTALTSSQTAYIEHEASDNENICGVYEGYINNGALLDRKAVNKIIPQEYVTNVENEDAWISGGSISFEECGRESLYDVLKKAAESGKGIRYICENGVEIYQTYKELLDEALKVAAGFRKLGIKKGDVAIFQTNERRGFLEAFWACMMTGVIFSPLETAADYENTDCAAYAKLVNINNLLEPKIIITENSVRERMNGLKALTGSDKLMIMTPDEIKTDASEFRLEVPDVDETALIMFTSGSTGMPKGVMLTQKNLIFRSKGTCELNGMGNDEISLNWLPLTHVGGIVMFHLRDTYTLAEQIQADVNMILNEPLMWLELCNKYRVTMTWSPLFAFSLINKHIDTEKDYGWDLSCIRNFISGGEANVAKTLRLFIKNLEGYGFDPNCVVPAFGMTETSSGITYFRDLSPDTTSDSDRFVPCGQPLRGIEIRITDNECNVKKKREVGYVEVRGTTITRGYFHNDKANADSFTEDGFFKTGDLGYIYNNILVLTGREKDIIILNGVNYFCQDIEDAVEMVDGVEPTCSIACGIVPHEQTEEELAIFFVPKDLSIIDADFEKGKEVISRIRNGVLQKFHLNAKYIMPVKAKYMEKTDIGKRQRSKIRNFYMNGEFENQEKIYCHRKKNLFYALEEYLMPKNGEQDDYAKLYSIFVFGGSTADKSVNESLASAGYVTVQDAETADRLIYTGFYDTLPDFSENEIKKNIEKLISVSKKADGGKNRKELFILLKNTFYYENDEVNNLNNGIIRGAVKGLKYENGSVSVRLIDIGDSPVSVIAEELSLYEDRSEVVYRNGRRYVYAYRSIAHDEQTVPYQLSEYKKFITVTGGTGGVGYILSKRFAEKYQANILILGKRPYEMVKGKIRALNECGGNVIYREADVTDFEAVDKAVSEAEEYFESELSTIVHCAGNFRSSDGKRCDDEKAEDYLMKNEAADDFYNVAKPKIIGTVNMEKIREKHNADELAVVSSLYGYYGGTAVGRYSAANSFQQAFCNYCGAKNGGKTFAVSFGEWENTGMSGNMSAEMKRASASILKSLGFKVNDTDKSADYFEYISSYVRKNSLIGVDRESYSRKYEITDACVPAVDIFGTNENVIEKAAVLADKISDKLRKKNINTFVIPIEEKQLLADQCSAAVLRKAGSTKKNTKTISQEHKKMIKIWEDVLGISGIGLFDDFFELGGNSILISKLMYEIEKSWGKEIDLRAVISDPTVDGLIKTLEGNEKNNENTVDILDVSKYIGSAEKTAEGKNNVFVTGSTGFVGAYLINSLLSNDADVRVYALVRAENTEKAAERLENTFERFGLSVDMSRIIPVCGDLSKDNIGLSDEDYRIICEDIDIIYHNGANVNFMYSYDQLKKENVEAVGEIIKIATTHTKKLLNLVSSIAVYGNDKSCEYDEDSEITPEYTVDSGYNKTKHDAEYLIQQAKKHGVRCNSFRVARTSGDSKTGFCTTDNYFWLMLKICFEIGAVPQISNDVVMFVPVDVTAAAVALLGQTDREGHNYNLYDREWDYKVYEWLKSYGIDLEVVDLDKWVELFKEKLAQKDDLKQYAALPDMITEEGINSTSPRINSFKTRQALKNAGFNFRCMNESDLHKIIDHFVNTGFFSTAYIMK